MCNCPKKTRMIQVRITPAEKQLLEDVARIRRIPLSELIRQSALSAATKVAA